MMKVGIIGAGTISHSHISAYKNNPECEVVAIADLNLSLAKKRAEEYEIEKVFSDYKELLKDEKIDAVSIVTPTFTHTEIVIDALKSGKNVLCEKPPALTADEVRRCAETAKETGKLLMYALVCRFRSQVQYLKRYIDSGKMGEFVYAEGARISLCTQFGGWFCDKSKSGGYLHDCAIHELDLILYLMGYPKPKRISGFVSNVNNDLPWKIEGVSKYNSSDKNNYDKTMESFSCGQIILDNGACVNIKASSVLNALNTGAYIDICAKNAGVRMEPNTADKKLELIEIVEGGYFSKAVPVINDNNPFQEEINHFVDCCKKQTECICKPDEAVALIEVINAIYKSAETGKVIEF